MRPAAHQVTTRQCRVEVVPRASRLPRFAQLVSVFAVIVAGCKSHPESVSPTTMAGQNGVLAAPVALPVAPSRTVVVTLDAAGGLSLDGAHVNDADLRVRLRARVALVPTLAATLSSPSNVPYARVVQVMDILRVCGVQEMSLVAATP